MLFKYYPSLPSQYKLSQLKIKFFQDFPETLFSNACLGLYGESGDSRRALQFSGRAEGAHSKLAIISPL
jgi:hypothetical protein